MDNTIKQLEVERDQLAAELRDVEAKLATDGGSDKLHDRAEELELALAKVKRKLLRLTESAPVAAQAALTEDQKRAQLAAVKDAAALVRESSEIDGAVRDAMRHLGDFRNALLLIDGLRKHREAALHVIARGAIENQSRAVEAAIGARVLTGRDDAMRHIAASLADALRPVARELAPWISAARPAYLGPSPDADLAEAQARLDQFVAKYVALAEQRLATPAPVKPTKKRPQLHAGA
jgi:hypothetical protein